MGKKDSNPGPPVLLARPEPPPAPPQAFTIDRRVIASVAERVSSSDTEAVIELRGMCGQLHGYVSEMLRTRRLKNQADFVRSLDAVTSLLYSTTDRVGDALAPAGEEMTDGDAAAALRSERTRVIRAMQAADTATAWVKCAGALEKVQRLLATLDGASTPEHAPTTRAKTEGALAPATTDLRVSGLQYAGDAFPSIRPGMNEFVLVSGGFSTVDLLGHLLSLTGPAYLDAASWCGSYGTMRAVLEFLSDERLLGFRMIMDGGFEGVRKGFTEWVSENVGDVVALVPNHAKFCALYNADWSLVIETSANLTKSKRTEHYRLMDSPEQCMWLVDYFDTIFRIRDSKGGGPLNKADLEAIYG